MNHFLVRINEHLRVVKRGLATSDSNTGTEYPSGLPESKFEQNGIHDTVFRSRFRFCDGRDISGVTNGDYLLKRNLPRKGKQRVPVRNPLPLATCFTWIMARNLFH